MAQPFGVGDVVGGRYRITHHVVTSADQDIVFQASDEVLDRDVSILLASRSNAKQVATSARELAVGARDSDVQVLDLGLADERTYLISSLVDPNHLLDLVVPDTAPYVEPFFTDSLGSELFGQSRIMEPETYEDDDEYYAALHSDSGDDRADGPARRFRRRRPAFLDKVSDSLNRRLNSENDAAALAVAAGQAEQARAAASAYLRTDMAVTSADPAADTDEDFSGAMDITALRTEAPAPSPQAQSPQSDSPETESPSNESPQEETAQPGSGPGRNAEGDAPQHVDPAGRPLQTTEANIADEDPADGEEVVDNPPDSPVDDFDLPSSTDSGSSAPLPGPARSSRMSDAISFTGLIRPVPSVEDEAAMQDPAAAGPGRSTRVPAAAAATTTGSALPRIDSSSGTPGRSETAAGADSTGPSGLSSGSTGSTPPNGEADDTDFKDEKPGIGRWLGAAALAVLLVVVAVVIFLNLRDGEPEDTASEAEQVQDPTEDAPADEAEVDDQEDGEPTQESSPTEADTGPEPAISTITRVVPDSPDLIAERDAQLSNLYDGDTGTSWVTLSFATADFGGLSSGVGLVAELEETTDISSVTVTQQGDTSGGSFEVLVNDSPSFEGAEQVGSGTLNWDETTVDVEGQGSYVIINITELPSQDSPNVDGLPYNAELTQISID